jgi:hypothetical protein
LQPYSDYFFIVVKPRRRGPGTRAFPSILFSRVGPVPCIYRFLTDVVSTIAVTHIPIPLFVLLVYHEVRLG